MTNDQVKYDPPKTRDEVEVFWATNLDRLADVFNSNRQKKDNGGSTTIETYPRY